MVDEFLKRGWRVIATLRNAETRKDIFADYFSLLTGEPNPLVILSLDVTNPEEREQVTQWVHQHGRLDALVNNAGYGLFGALEDLSEDQLRHQMEVNCFGAALLTRSLLPYLRQSHGSVTFISSTFGYLGFPLTSAYCASKFALEGLAESLYYELQPYQVRVALIEPGASRSNFGVNVQWGEKGAGNGEEGAGIGEEGAGGETAEGERQKDKLGVEGWNPEVYAVQRENYYRIRANLKANARNLAPVVARQVADVAEGRDRRFRIQVGRDGAIAHTITWLIPEGLRHVLFSRLYQKMFLRQEKL